MSCPLFPLLLMIAGLLTTAANGEVKGSQITVRDGDVSIEVPVPAGFARIPESDERFAADSSRLAGNGNELLVYLAESAKGTARRSGRSMSVGINKDGRGIDVTKETLEKLRLGAEKDGQEMLSAKKQEAGMSGLTIDPVTDFSSRHFSVVTHLAKGNGKEKYTIASAVLIRGRVWYFLVTATGGPEERTWASSIAAGWVASAIGANPSDSETLRLEERTRSGMVFDLLIKVMIFGVITCLAVGIARTKKRKREVLEPA